jgi:hypothetical protein
MTTGNVLYLAMAVGTFVLFSAVLALETLKQSRVANSARSSQRNEAAGPITA